MPTKKKSNLLSFWYYHYVPLLLLDTFFFRSYGKSFLPTERTLQKDNIALPIVITNVNEFQFSSD